MSTEAADRRLARRIAEHYGLDPDLFERQIQQESGFNRNAVSPAGARGIAQFMPGTAPGWNVDLHDGRVEDDLRGAARYIRYYLRKFGSYRDALIAYNAGPGNVGKPLPAETENYLKAILGSSTATGPTKPGNRGGGKAVAGGRPPRSAAEQNAAAAASSGEPNKAVRLLLAITLVAAGTVATLAGTARLVGVRSPLSTAGGAA